MSNKPAQVPKIPVKTPVTNKSKSAELAAAANQRRRTEQETRRQQVQAQQRLILLIGAVALLVMVIVAVVLLSRPPTADFVSNPTDYTGVAVGTTQTGPNASIKYPIAFPYMGNPNAPIKIEEISSFSCPFCLQYHDSTVSSITDEIKAGRAQFVYIFTTLTGDFDAMPGTSAAVCAMQQNQFWQMHDVLFNWQKTYAGGASDRARLEVAAQHLGLDMGKFDSCMTNPATKQYISDSNDYANKRGMVGTPTIFLFTNGTQMQPAPNANSSSQTPGSVAGLSLSNLRGVMEAASLPTQVSTAQATAAATAALATVAVTAPVTAAATTPTTNAPTVAATTAATTAPATAAVTKAP